MLSDEAFNQIKKTWMSRFLYIVLLVFSRALQIITPTYTRDTFETIEILDRIKPVMKQPKALLGFLKIPTVFYEEALAIITT